MQLAQELYEGVDIGKERFGLITYMRTDSTRISDLALNQLRDFIKTEYGKEYLPSKPFQYKNSKGSQDAHECIRPSDITKTPDSLKSILSRDLYKLYNLIWTRFIACQMNHAKYAQTTVEITGGKGMFRATDIKTYFRWIFKSISYIRRKKIMIMKIMFKLPKLEKNTKLNLNEVTPEQHFTEPPPRYTDATIVKKLEESGIGRPSTYAPTIATLLKRYYVNRKQKQLIPTELGKLTNDILLKYFSEFINEEFTAAMEEKLDKVEENNLNWSKMIKDFYGGFEKTINEAKLKADKIKTHLDEETDEVCEKCGSPMLKKLGRNGFFLACSAFPKCNNAKPIPLGPCPKEDCDGKIIHIRMKGKRAFYGCTNYPDCDFTTWNKPSGEFCNVCVIFLLRSTVKIRDII